jgi:secernin
MRASEGEFLCASRAAATQPHGRSWSCDSFVVMPPASADGSMLMGKNSDRPVNETQPLRYLPSRLPSRGDRLQLAYVEIPDACDTLAHVGASPYWCWGHELGLNQRGVAIGNEALFTRDLALNQHRARAGDPPEPGILGMELVRLGLERGRTAVEAVDVMTALLERYGQWGAGVRGQSAAEGAYDNSYLIADGREAWVLETTGRRWIAARVRHSTWSISNQATIRTDWDRASDDLAEHALEAGWWPDKDAGRFDFAAAYTDPQVPLQISHIRLQRSRQLLREAVPGGGVDVAAAAAVLRDHYEGTFLEGPYFNAARPDFMTLCMHSHPSGFTWGNTASSAIFVLPSDDRPPYLWWAAATPCTSVYVPVFVDAPGLPDALGRSGSVRATSVNPEQAPEDAPADGSYWWTFQRLLDVVKGDALGSAFTDRQPQVRDAFDRLETAWRGELSGVVGRAVELRSRHGRDAGAEVLGTFTRHCVDQALGIADTLLEQFSRGLPASP